VLVASKLVGFWRFGLFSGWWRHVSVRDTEDIIRANLLGSGLFFLGVGLVNGLDGFPRSVFLSDFLLCTALIAGTRITVRILRERGGVFRETRRIDRAVLIVGAGSAGIRLLTEIGSRKGGNTANTAVVGFVDDDPEKQGMRISGVPVVGRVDEIPGAVADLGVDEVLIAIPSAGAPVIRRIAARCAEANVRSRVLPSLSDLVEGRFIYTQMREPNVDDLLGRTPIDLASPVLRSFLADRGVLVTGAAGSIGSELCRQVAGHRPRRLVLFDRHENGIFSLEAELRQKHPDLDLLPVLGDILLQDQLSAVFAEAGPDVVFHAAAYKHVPLAEANVVEAVRNNVLGTRNVVRQALASGCANFVLVSTDKAARPSSVMGATKRIAEQTVRDLAGDRSGFVAVRFGNVLGSNGSVVPLFRDQISRGGPVTVTHPEVTRFFMTIPEAVQLVLQAATVGRSGETLVLEMGRAVRIVDLARQMIELSGFVPGEDIEIVFTGLRPGEKLHEELLDDGEEMAPTSVSRVSSLGRSGGDAVPARDFLPRFEALVANSDAQGLLALVREVVPSFRGSADRGRAAGEPEGRLRASA
jgi:FlaA1/EpsC-like NDP-sugar epimerase